MKRPNLTVLTRAQVQRLEVEGGRATGVTLAPQPARRRSRLTVKYCCAQALSTRRNC